MSYFSDLFYYFHLVYLTLLFSYSHTSFSRVFFLLFWLLLPVFILHTYIILLLLGTFNRISLHFLSLYFSPVGFTLLVLPSIHIILTIFLFYMLVLIFILSCAFPHNKSNKVSASHIKMHLCSNIRSLQWWHDNSLHLFNSNSDSVKGFRDKRGKSLPQKFCLLYWCF